MIVHTVSTSSLIWIIVLVLSEVILQGVSMLRLRVPIGAGLRKVVLSRTMSYLSL